MFRTQLSPLPHSEDFHFWIFVGHLCLLGRSALEKANIIDMLSRSISESLDGSVESKKIFRSAFKQSLREGHLAKGDNFEVWLKLFIEYQSKLNLLSANYYAETILDVVNEIQKKKYNIALVSNELLKTAKNLMKLTPAPTTPDLIGFLTTDRKSKVLRMSHYELLQNEAYRRLWSATCQMDLAANYQNRLCKKYLKRQMAATYLLDMMTNPQVILISSLVLFAAFNINISEFFANAIGTDVIASTITFGIVLLSALFIIQNNLIASLINDFETVQSRLLIKFLKPQLDEINSLPHKLQTLLSSDNFNAPTVKSHSELAFTLNVDTEKMRVELDRSMKEKLSYGDWRRVKNTFRTGEVGKKVSFLFSQGELTMKYKEQQHTAEYDESKRTYILR